LEAAVAVLLKRDRNDDEIITPEEIQGRGNAQMFGDGEIAFFLNSSSSTYFGATPGPFRVVSSDDSGMEVAKAMQRYLPKADGKKPQRQKIARKELGLDEATFKLLDVDGDGFLDFEELQRFAHRPPDLELKVEIGKTPSVEVVKRGAAMEK